MNIAIASRGRQAHATERPHPLGSVVTWELRRFSASRIFWVQAVGFFFVLLLVVWGLHASHQISLQLGAPGTSGGHFISGFVAGTSAWGLLHTLPTCLVLLILVVPFVTADGVTRDLQRRTHELVMTTAVPTWAYVLGRYLVGLMMSLGLALLMLAAILGMGLLLHVTVPDYPLPSTGALVLLWVGMVLPATILVTSLGFAIVTLLPRLSTLIKVVILVVWIIGALVIPGGMDNQTPPGWYVNWDPTSAVTALGMLSQYSVDDLLRTATTEAQFQNAFVAIENTMPSVGSWFASHLLLAGLSLVIVLIVPFAFKRSRDVVA